MMFEPEDNRPYRVAWVVALLVHFGAFVVVVPFDGPRIEAAAQEELTVIRVYEPPPPPEPENTPTRKRRANPVPIPDATPDELEPIVSETEREWVEPVEAPEVTYQLAPPAGGPPVAAETQVYRPGPHVQRPELIERIEPEYPEIARRARLACTVILEAHIGSGGEVIGVEVLRPCGLGLDKAAVDAVSQWRYAPTLVDGRPVEVALTVTVVFQLQ